MLNPVFAIRDRKGDFWHPRVDQSEASVKRWFAMLVNDETPQNLVHFCPTDFELYQIGEYDSEKGKLIPLETIEFVVSGESLIGVTT